MIKITIDGPSGAGKSTISKLIADRLGYVYIDTGAMYRAVGLHALRQGLDTAKDREEIALLLDGIQITMEKQADGQHVFLNGEDVSKEIRTPEASVAASNVAVIPQVRLKLVDLQRRMAESVDVVMDGRDAGTYVLPDAQIKLFLTASVEDRAQRRLEELRIRGIETTYEDVLEDMKYRDKNDSSRDFAPLKPAQDAVAIDTTGNSFDQSAALVLRLITDKLAEL